jgi:hypothetical protein
MPSKGTTIEVLKSLVIGEGLGEFEDLTCSVRIGEANSDDISPSDIPSETYLRAFIRANPRSAKLHRLYELSNRTAVQISHSAASTELVVVNLPFTNTLYTQASILSNGHITCQFP